MKTIILGPAGKMGSAMVACAYVRPDVELIGAVGPRGRDYIGKDIGLVCNLGSLINLNIHDCLEVIIDQCDVVLDCTMPQVSMQALECCVNHRKTFVSGTTGFSDDQKRSFERAGEAIPVLLATNTSKIFNLLFDLIKDAASKIDRQADIDIIDMHDNIKLDAPSGTSKQIAEIISKELEFKSKDYTYGRNGIGKRKANSIAFSSIRTGGLPGSIKVIFGYRNERMELSAHVYNMNTYANGMIDASLFLVGKKPGLYSLKELFNP
jgi:4-hydroxy-tetrahydrodipicolinate reductase